MKKVLVCVTSVVVVALTAISGAAKVPGTNVRIAFEQADPASRDGGTFVFTANPDGSDVRWLVPSYTCCASWSPDGSKLAIAAMTDDDRITSATVNPDGSGYEVKTIPDPTLNLGCNVWSPDGKRFACEGWDEVHPNRAAGLFSVRTSDFGGLVRLTRNPYGRSDTPGDYSPGGTRIAFLRGRPHRPEDQVAVFVAKSDGSHIRRVTAWAGTGCCKVSWSPNGKRIGFTLCRRQCDIYTMRRDGTHVVRLTNTPEFKEFDDWGPSLAFGADRLQSGRVHSLQEVREGEPST